VTWLPLNHWQAENIFSGLPEIHAETSDRFFLPLDAPLPEGDIVSECITPQQEHAVLMRIRI
jgi:hypothetical protein